MSPFFVKANLRKKSSPLRLLCVLVERVFCINFLYARSRVIVLEGECGVSKDYDRGKRVKLGVKLGEAVVAPGSFREDMLQ